jgi:hypothetical protein
MLTACKKSALPVQTPDASILPPKHYGEAMQMQENRSGLHQFIINELTGEFGVFTNYLDTDQNADAASGHEVLSESQGLLMRYYALTGQQAAFDAEWALTQQTFNLKTGLSYRYSPKQQKKHSINAAVDDLRIIRALHEAGEQFKDEKYVKDADTYGSRLYEHNTRNGYLYDFYDEGYKTTNAFITLCYIDLKTLQKLPLSSKQRLKLTENMQEIAKNGYLSDQFPFYETRYEYETDSYSSGPIHTVESLLTILALVEVQQHNPLSIQYVKEQVRAGTLYGQYTREGKPSNDIQSTAIYAITAIIGSQLGDGALYEDSIHRMNAFKVQDAGSPLNGGFGYVPKQQAYSFDNLMALLAYTY